MPLHHSRRRRVLTEDPAAAQAAAVNTTLGASSAARAEAYAAAARRDQQPHVTDVVPLGWLAQTLCLLSGLTVIAALETAYTWLPEMSAALGAASVAALDLASAGSLAHWYSSVLLGTGGVLALLVYRLRSHRVDDYRGRYRLWRWAVLAALALSVNEICQLDRLGAALVTLAARGTTLSPAAVLTPDRIWAISCAVLWGLAAVRVLFEVRRSLPASLLLVLAAADLLALATLPLWSRWDLTVAPAVMLVAGLRMAGHLLLLASVGLYARHVILEAEGRLGRPAAKSPQRAKRKRKAAAAADGEAADGSSEKVSEKSGAKSAGKVYTDPPHKTPGPHSQRSDSESASRTAARANSSRPESPADRKMASSAASSDPQSDNEDGDGDTDDRGMTRAERKRLKRMQR